MYMYIVRTLVQSLMMTRMMLRQFQWISQFITISFATDNLVCAFFIRVLHSLAINQQQ